MSKIWEWIKELFKEIFIEEPECNNWPDPDKPVATGKISNPSHAESEEDEGMSKIILTSDMAKDYKEANGSPDIAILVGHNTEDQGAENYKKESEYSFNSRIAEQLLPRIESHAVILKRPPVKSYTANCIHIQEVVKELKVPLVVALHFNAYNRSVLGSEALLITTASELDDKLGDKVTDLLNEKLGFKERGQDGVKLLSAGTRAYKMHEYVKSAGGVLVTIEPCFANFRNSESQQIFENEDRYVEILAEAINEVMADS